MAQSGSLSTEMEKLSNVLSLVNTFRAFDSDNDGLITAAELGGILSSLGYKTCDEDVRAMMQQADSNKDGLLSLEEFLEMNTKDMELGDLSNFFRAAFESLHLDGDEMLTGEELHEIANNLGSELSLANCQDIISSLDGDGDGAVSFEEFQLMVHSLL